MLDGTIRSAICQASHRFLAEPIVVDIQLLRDTTPDTQVVGCLGNDAGDQLPPVSCPFLKHVEREGWGKV